MNKDELKKKMLKERFLFIDKTGEPHMAIKVDKFTELIDQLDESEKPKIPDMTKEEIIEEYGMTQKKWNELIERYKWHLEYEGYTVTKKPVIPEFVGEFIEHSKSGGYTLQQTFYLIHSNYKQGDFDEVVEWVSDNEDTFTRAWLDGWTMEEKKYQVRDKNGYALILKQGDGKIYKADSTPMAPDCSWDLTEKEIKDYDERYWLFADEVTE